MTVPYEASYEYDDGYTRESFERAEEDTEESLRDPADGIDDAISLLQRYGYEVKAPVPFLYHPDALNPKD